MMDVKRIWVNGVVILVCCVLLSSCLSRDLTETSELSSSVETSSDTDSTTSSSSSIPTKESESLSDVQPSSDIVSAIEWKIPQDAPEWLTEDLINGLEQRYSDIRAENAHTGKHPIFHLSVALVDITFDGIPEICYGYGGISTRDYNYFHVYSITEKRDIIDEDGILADFMEGSNEDSYGIAGPSSILTDKYYIDKNNRSYFESVVVTYSGTMFVAYVHRFYKEGLNWRKEYNCFDLDSLNQDDYANNDKSYPLINAVVDVPNSVGEALYNCYKQYEEKVKLNK